MARVRERMEAGCCSAVQVAAPDGCEDKLGACGVVEIYLSRTEHCELRQHRRLAVGDVSESHDSKHDKVGATGTSGWYLRCGQMPQ
eukprot:3658610-Rhodomonas_salina.1